MISIKTYSLNKKTDIDKFCKDLKQSVINVAKQNLPINCPKCKNEIKVHPGHNACPICGQAIFIDLTIQ